MQASSCETKSTTCLHSDDEIYDLSPSDAAAGSSLLQSELVKVDLKTGTVARRFPGIGTKSHGLVAWRGSLLVLDSEGRRLLRVNPHNGSHTSLYQVQHVLESACMCNSVRVGTVVLQILPAKGLY